MKVAAIAIVLRARNGAGDGGWELLWVRRSPTLAFLGGFWAFPGGGVEPSDVSLGAACARELAEETQIHVAPEAFVPAGRTVTPEWAAPRIDASYFVVDAGWEARADTSRAADEIVDAEWTRPEEALVRWERGERLTSLVGVRVLRAVQAGGSARDIAGRLAESLAAGAATDALRLHELIPGLGMAPLRSPTIPPATHTNCFAVGTNEVIVVDPGSPYPEEQRALDEGLAGRRVREIWVTHHHIDHVAGVEHLRALHGVPVAAHRGTAELLHGSLRFDRLLQDNEVVALGPRRLRVVFTPGHTMGHLTFLDETTRWVLAGDHVAGVGTVVIDPDDGDMSAYLASIDRLEALEPRLLLPAHGPIVTEASAKLAEYRKHRLWREARVFDALSTTPRPVAEMVPAVYDDVPPAMLGYAERSLRAHLLKLIRDGRVGEVSGAYFRRP